MIKTLYLRIKKKGIKKSLIGAFSIAYDKYFDFKYNLDTYSWVSVNDLGVESHNKKHAVLYQATRVISLKKLFKRLKIPKDQILVDIGCGKGRVLIIASEFGFKEVRGIEFSPLLCAIAKDNIFVFNARNQTHTKFEIINSDAAEYKYKGDEDVFFLYNPFDSYIMKKVLQNISDSINRQKRQVKLIYNNPRHRDLIQSYMKIKKELNFHIWSMEFVVYEVEGTKSIL